MKMTTFWDIACTLTMEAVSASETAVSFYDTTRRSIPESCHLDGMEY
jgi:hypothetical protein